MFIKLHNQITGKSFRINVAHIVTYNDNLVYADTEEYFHVRETAEDIDKLLGLWED